MKLLCIHYLACLVVLLGAAACGSPEPVGAPPAEPGSPDALVQEHCGRCHAGQSPRLQSVADLRANGARAKARIEARTMPPDRGLSAESKRRLLEVIR